MTLTTHIVIAAAVAKPFASVHPAFSFLAAIASHYLSDAIPHWDYELQSEADEDISEKRRWVFSHSSLLKDLRHLAFDGVLGTTVAILLLSPHSAGEWSRTLLIIVGGALPDFLEGLYYTRRANFLKPLHLFHSFTHTKIKLGPYPLIGVPFQLLILIISVLLLI